MKKNLFVVLLFLLLVPCSFADSFSVNPTDDAYINSGAGKTGTNYNGNNLYVGSYDPSGNRFHFLLGFNLSLATGTITNCTLSFYPTGKSGTGYFRIYNTTSDNWDESTVTYASKPVNASILVNHAFPASGAYHNYSSSDLINYCEAQRLLDGNMTLFVSSFLSGSNYFVGNDKENGGNIPILYVEFEAGVPAKYYLTTYYFVPVNTVTVNSVVVSNASETEFNDSDLAVVDGGLLFDRWLISGSETHNRTITRTMSANITVYGYGLSIGYDVMFFPTELVLVVVFLFLAYCFSVKSGWYGRLCAVFMVLFVMFILLDGLEYYAFELENSVLNYYTVNITFENYLIGILEAPLLIWLVRLIQVTYVERNQRISSRI